MQEPSVRIVPGVENSKKVYLKGLYFVSKIEFLPKGDVLFRILGIDNTGEKEIKVIKHNTDSSCKVFISHHIALELEHYPAYKIECYCKLYNANLSIIRTVEDDANGDNSEVVNFGAKSVAGDY